MLKKSLHLKTKRNLLILKGMCDNERNKYKGAVIMKMRLLAILLAFVVFNLTCSWGQSFNMPVMQQPQMITPQMPSFDSQRTFSTPNMNINMPSIGMPQYNFPACMQMPAIQMPQSQSNPFFSTDGNSNFNRQSENVFNNIRFPTNQVQPFMIDPFKDQSKPYKILSNIMPRGNLPGSISHNELSQQEMLRMGFSPKTSNLENGLLAGKGRNEAISYSDSNDLLTP